MALRAGNVKLYVVLATCPANFKWMRAGGGGRGKGVWNPIEVRRNCFFLFSFLQFNKFHTDIGCSDGVRKVIWRTNSFENKNFCWPFSRPVFRLCREFSMRENLWNYRGGGRGGNETIAECAITVFLSVRGTNLNKYEEWSLDSLVLIREIDDKSGILIRGLEWEILKSEIWYK